MRIAFITDKSAPFFVGGYENRVFELARRLATRHDVRVFTSLAQSTETVDGVQFERVCPPTFQREVSGDRSLPHSALFAMALIPTRLRKFSPDVIVIEAVPYAHLVTMRRWIRDLGSIVLLDVVEAWHEYRYTRFPGLDTLSRRTIRSCLATGLECADGVLAISQATAKSLVRNYGADSSRVSLVPLGLGPTPAFDPRAQTSICKEFDVITVSRLVPTKRIADLVAALAALKKEMAWNGKAVIVGSGPQGPALASLVKRYGLAQQIHLAGFVSEIEKRRLLRQSRVFVLPSEREGFSLATLEAMGEGVPAIVARPTHDEVFGPADFVEDRRNGLYYPVGDPDALARQLKDVLNEAQMQSRLSEAAAETAAAYTWDSVAVRLERAIERSRAPSPDGM